MILISVCVLCYNHEKYIRQTLDGILMQEGDFLTEILVNDDASTDSSAQIIEEYRKKYPNIIKPLYHSSNQYSKGVTNLSGLFNFPRAKGEYIAMCEGDDFWTDKNKLSMQLSYLEKYKNCSLCFHSAENCVVDGSFTDSFVRPYKESRVISSREIIEKKSGYPTASLFFRREYIDDLPKFYFDCAVGDIPLQLILANKGDAFYIDKVMSVYRVGDSGSWSNRAKAGDYINKQEAYLKNICNMYDAFNEYSDYRFDESIKKAKKIISYQVALNTKRYNIIYSYENREYLEDLSFRYRCLMYLEYKCPKLYRFLSLTSNNIFMLLRKISR